MSVTFWAVGVPDEEFEPYASEPGYKEKRPVAPFFELNLTNGNAAAVLEALQPGVPYECGGSWNKETLPKVLAQAVTLLTTDAGVLSLVEPTVKEGNYYECGRSATYVNQRLAQFSKLIALAIQHDKTIAWG